jgi:SNF2 family DNA or RNA helicase
MDSSTSTCYLCDNSFDVDELQKFQPGFVLEWRSNLELENSVGGNTGSVRRITDDREHLLRPSVNRRRSKKFGDGHTCEYDNFSADGCCIHCLEEHSFCCLMNARGRCEICHRISEDCPKDESKSYYLSRRLLELVEEKRSMPVNFSNELLFQDSMRPLKVIVYSQFRAALNFIGDRLLRKFGTARIAEYFGSHRKKELQKFTMEPMCFCLLLTKDGSEGLDLSFVTNVIFLEEVFDKSLEDQVVARAWRMGAKGKVSVETLIAKNSMEVVIGNHSSEGCDQGEDDATTGIPTGEKQRLKSLLLSLRFITDHHNFSSSVTTTSIEDANIAGTEEINIGSLKRELTLPVLAGSTKKAKRQRTVRFVDIL